MYWFSTSEALVEIAMRGIVCFIGLIILLRISGKRTLTKMNAFDFIMTFTIGSTLASVITSRNMAITEGMLALTTIIGVQYIIAWLEVRSDWFQDLIKSQPAILFQHETYQQDMMRKERITSTEIKAAMRYNGFADPSQVDMVIMETDGQLSVIPKDQSQTSYAALDCVQGYQSRTS